MNPFERFSVMSIGAVNALKAALDFKAAVEKLEHMNIDTTYKRAVRIIGKPGVTHPHTISVSDASTGEELTNIKEAIIYLDASKVSKVILVYYEKNEQGNIVTDANKEPIQGKTTIISEKHEIDITAYEV